MALAFAGITLVFVVSLILIIYGLFNRNRNEVSHRLDTFIVTNLDTGEVETKRIGRHLFARLIRILEPRNSKGRIELKIEQAGLNLQVGEFVAFQILLTVVGLVFGLVMKLGLLKTGIFTVSGYAFPIIWLAYKAIKRRKALGKQIVNALEMMSGSLKAGHSFLQAMEMVAKEMDDPIAYEFALLLKEMNLGKPTEEALIKMGERLANEDLNLAITAVLIQRQVGGNLAEILDNISITIRERIRIQGEIKTLTAQGRISGIIISSLPIAVGGFVFVINPEYIRPLIYEPLGRIALGGALVSQLIGALFIKKIITIEV